MCELLLGQLTCYEIGEKVRTCELLSLCLNTSLKYMRSLLTLIVLLCSLTEEKLLSLELQSENMLNCRNTILVDNATLTSVD